MDLRYCTLIFAHRNLYGRVVIFELNFELNRLANCSYFVQKTKQNKTNKKKKKKKKKKKQRAGYQHCTACRPFGLFVCVEVIRPSQPNGGMSSAVSYLTTRLLGRLSPLSG